MGGWNSGRWYRGATKAEHLASIDLAYLNRVGNLTPGCGGVLRWNRSGEPAGSIGYFGEKHGLTLVGAWTREGGSSEPFRQTILFDATDQPFGGRRRWLLCPVCRRRCRVVYLANRFACRTCLRLVYASQWEDIRGPGIAAARHVRDRLGGSLHLEDPFPTKPKGMHWKTYDRLFEADLAANDAWHEAFTAVALKRFGKFASLLD